MPVSVQCQHKGRPAVLTGLPGPVVKGQLADPEVAAGQQVVPRRRGGDPRPCMRHARISYGDLLKLLK
jgi:hypothetical protein